MTPLRSLQAPLGGPGATDTARAAPRWHSSFDIQTLAGLAGTHQWYENPIFPAWITIRFLPGAEGVFGYYELRRLFAPGESGTIQCWSSPNSISGQAFIVLTSGETNRPYLVNAALVDGNWRILYMILSRDPSTEPPAAPFAVVRAF